MLAALPGALELDNSNAIDARAGALVPARPVLVGSAGIADEFATRQLRLRDYRTTQ